MSDRVCRVCRSCLYPSDWRVYCPSTRSDGGKKAVIDEVRAAAAGREDLYRLARTVYADSRQAMRAAAELRDRHFGPRVTYSRKVFVPLTELCRDNCGYCTFAHPPRPGKRIYPTPEEVLRIARLRRRGVQTARFSVIDPHRMMQTCGLT